MMRRIGADPDRVLLRLPLELRYADGFHLRAPRAPCPFNLLFALLGAKRLSLAQVPGAVRFMAALRAKAFNVGADRPVARWLDEHAQTGVLRSHLWEPLCVSALNTPVELASAQVFANVLRDGLTGKRENSDILLARTDLGRLFPEPAAGYVKARGGTIELGASVRTLTREGGGFRLDDRPQRFTAAIVACAPQHAAPLLSGFEELAATRAVIEQLDYQPIVTCYLQYPESVSLPAPMLGLGGGMVQWVFDRGRLGGSRGENAGLLAAVISASGPHMELTQEALASRIDIELNATLGALPPLRWTRVITEKRATFSCTPGVRRPQAVTAVPGLTLAGDYVASDYPGTLESAVRSGITAASRTIESLTARL